MSTVRQQYEDLWKECTSLRNALISSKVCVCVCVCVCVVCAYLHVLCVYLHVLLTCLYNYYELLDICIQEEVHTATEQLISLQTQKLQLEQKLKEVHMT